MKNRQELNLIIEQSTQSKKIDCEAFIDAFVNDLFNDEVENHVEKIQSIIADNNWETASKSIIKIQQRENMRRNIELQIEELENQLVKLNDE